MNVLVNVRFDEDGLHDLASSKVWTQAGTIDFTKEGLFGGKCAYSRKTGYFTSPVDERLSFGTNDVTISFWTRVLSYAGGRAMGIFGNATSARGDAFNTSGGYYKQCYLSLEPFGFGLMAADLGLDVWHHVAIVRKGNKFTCFIDGKNVAESDAAPNVNFQLGSTVHSLMTSGYNGNFGSYPLDGYLDDFVILDSALWEEDFEVPESYLVDILENANIIMEKYQLEDGTETSKQKKKYIMDGKDYTATAPKIEGRECIGYKVDGGILQTGNTVNITAVNASHEVVFVYKKTTVEYLVGKKWLEFNNIFFISNEGSDENPGTKQKPLKTFKKAAQALKTDDDAIVFLPGEYTMPCMPLSQYTECFFSTYGMSDVKKVSIIGQGKNSIFYCDASKKISARDGNLIGTQAKTDFYRMNFKFSTRGGNYESALISASAYINLYNCAVENIGSQTMSISYHNGAQKVASFYNCMLKANGKIAGDYSGNLENLDNTLLDWNYTNAYYVKNKLVRTINNDDYLTGSATDLIAEDKSIIGVYGGDYTWGEGSYHFVTERFQNAQGADLMEVSVKLVEQGGEYRTTAPFIENHFCTGYTIDGGLMQSNPTAVIANVSSDHEVVFIYENIGPGADGGNNPSGMIMYFASESAPAGWLTCDGTVVSRNQYVNLFAAIGTRFGDGDGKSTFALPDLRGEFVRGFDAGRGVDEDRSFGSSQKASVQAFDPTKTSIFAIGMYNSIDDDTVAFQKRAGMEPVNQENYPGVVAAGTNNATSIRNDEVCLGAVRPRNIALLPCIKY